ncbi:sulfotransferase, partial [Streptosporangium sp. NPDC001681]
SRALRVGSSVGRFLPSRVSVALTDPLERKLQRRARSRQPLTWEQREKLISHFTQDVALLQRVTGEDFSDWLRPRERSGGLVGVRPNGQRQARNGRPQV